MKVFQLEEINLKLIEGKPGIKMPDISTDLMWKPRSKGFGDRENHTKKGRIICCFKITSAFKIDLFVEIYLVILHSQIFCCQTKSLSCCLVKRFILSRSKLVLPSYVFAMHTVNKLKCNIKVILSLLDIKLTSELSFLSRNNSVNWI